MYKKVSTSLNFVEREKEIEKYWEENKIFEKSLELREGKFRYQDLAAFGHIGRTDIDLPWERVNKAEELKKILL